MAKSADAFRTISEVAEWLEVPAHVLRFWESKFSQIKPVKRAGGRRYYRPVDMLLLGGIKALLHDEGMTIKGVQKLLREHGVRHVSDLSQRLDEVTEGEVSDIALDVKPEPLDLAKVLNFARSRGAPPVAPPAIGEATTEAAQDTEEDVAVAPAADAPSPPIIPADASKPIPKDALSPYEALVTSASGPARQDHAPDITDQDDADATTPDLITTPEPEAEDTTPEPDAQALTDAPGVTPVTVSEPEPEHDVEAASEPETEATSEPTPLPQPDLPEDPQDAITADPGLLSALADLPRPISPETAERLGPLLARLSALGATKSQDGQRRD